MTQPRLTSCIRRVVLISAVAASSAWGTLAQQPPDEEVIVTAHAYPAAFANVARTVKVLTREDLANLPISSVADALRYAAVMDIRQRGPFGAQADLSIRGSSFGQVLVLIDGIRLNDSQTAHHNTDFPINLDDIERIEILAGPGSSLYGADAFGGAVNIITRKQESGARASVTTGQHGLVQASAKATVDLGSIDETISIFGNRSSGFMPNRDFTTAGVTSRTAIGEKSTLFLSQVNKEFGAAGFYGPAPSREWTTQSLVSFERRLFENLRRSASLQVFYRTHGDRFLWDVQRPGFFENRHRTHALGATARLEAILSPDALLSVGTELGSDWIRSTNLGDHSYTRASASAELQLKLGKWATLYPGFRFDRYSTFGGAACPSLSASYWLRPTVRVRSSVGRAFRAPSFTERYYRDPNHQASPGLAPETSWGAETGADWIPKGRSIISANVFRRWERNVIDWTRLRTTDKWVSSNHREIESSGVELSFERSFSGGARLQVGYARLWMEPGEVVGLSKYALDYARHSYVASGAAPLPWGLVLGQRLDYRRRSDGRRYLILDSRLSRQFGRLTLRLDCSNLLNTRYQEIVGVDMPGRWATAVLEVAR